MDAEKLDPEKLNSKKFDSEILDLGDRNVIYKREIVISTDELHGILYITDCAEEALKLRNRNEAVLIYLHENNRNQDFSGFLYAVEDISELDSVYLERVYRRLKKLPWKILETERCIIRETTPEDVDAFWKIYSDPEITRYTEGLYPEKEQEKAYIEEYIEKVYAYYECGVWTIVEKESGEVIGRAGFSFREGYENPEIGFVISRDRQRKGYAYEVCTAILEYGKKVLGFDHVQVLVERENVPSLKLCHKLGFGEEEELNIGEKQYYMMHI